MNATLTNCGLYTDIINLVNDYTVGDSSYWKGKYDSVTNELITEKSESTFVLGRKLSYQTRRKIACIMQMYSDSVNNHEKTASIYDNFKRYGVVGIHRVAFDNLVFKVKQMMKVKNYTIYKYKSNCPPSFDFHISPKLLRHICDYNHTEYECYFVQDKRKMWISKMNWGNREFQQMKRKIGNEIKLMRKKKKQWAQIKKDEKENSFAINFKLTNKIKIMHINQKSVRIRVNIGDGKHVLVTKKINQDEKSERYYICDPVIKKRRLYADEKYMECPSVMMTLYKNM